VGVAVVVDGDGRLLRVEQDAPQVVSFSSSTVRSTSETLGVGTRTEVPLSLPFKAGITSATALAAPVVEGIIESAAARARRRSLCGRSSRFWSLV
jgi:hypothetical protein